MFAALTVTMPIAATSVSTVELVNDLPGIAIGILLIVLGVGMTCVFFVRRRAPDRTLLYLGLYGLLYGARLLVRQHTAQLLVPWPDTVWTRLDWWITWIVVIPAGLFLRELLDGPERRVVGWVIRAQVVLATLGILSDLTGVGLATMRITNNAVIILLLPALLALALRPRRHGAARREMRILLVGLVVLALFVLHANLVGLHVIPGRDLEAIGVLVFFACLGIIAAGRMFSTEQRLSAIQRELEIARRIQTAILPAEVPRIPGLEIAARYAPMSEVAGDFYDFLAVDSAGLGVLVADVSGHGVPAALIASMLKVALSAQHVHAAEPARVLDGINQALIGRSERQFVTAGYAWIDFAERRVTYAGAAHPSLLWWRHAPRRVEEVTENGLPLGQFAEARYLRVRLDVGSGDRLVFYTDGVPEAEGPNRELFGAERLNGFLASHHELGADALADGLMRELDRWISQSQGGARTDDVTVLVVGFR